MKAKIIYLMIKDILENHGDMVDELHIIEQTECYDEEEFRIYQGEGYCFDVKKVFVCEDDEVDNFEDVDKEGFSYETYFGWDGFKECDDNIAIELLKRYTLIPKH